jgi:hypothetical protein
MLPFIPTGKVPDAVPPVRRNAAFNPYGKRDLKTFEREDIVKNSRMTVIEASDFDDFLKTGTAPNIAHDDFLEAAYVEARSAFHLECPVSPFALDKPGWEEIQSRLDMSSTAGYPTFRSQGDVLDKIYHDAHQLGHFMKYKPPSKMRFPPCYLAMKPAKHDLITGKRKYREIFEYPAAMKINEMRYSLPLYEAYHSLPLSVRPILSGEEPRRMTELYYLNQLNPNPFVLKTDFSSFNQSCSEHLIDLAFNILAENINFGGYPYSASHARRNYVQFLNLKHYFIRTPFVLHDRRVFTTQSGVPSGSGFTLLINSIITRIVVTACLLRLTGDYPKAMKTTGDDCSCSPTQLVDLKALSVTALLYGFTLNPEKQYSSETSAKMEGFKLLGYIGFPYTVRFDSKTLWENTYLCKNFVLTKDDHLARVHSLWSMTEGKDKDFDLYYNYCLVTYGDSTTVNVPVITRPSVTFAPSGVEQTFGKQYLSHALWTILTKKSSPGEHKSMRYIKYYWKIAEKYARAYYFKHRRDVTAAELETTINQIYDGTVLNNNWFPPLMK